MKVNVSELKGRALNYAVAVCLWGDPSKTKSFFNWIKSEKFVCASNNPWPEDEENEFNPSENWAHGGPLIEMHRMTLQQHSGPAAIINDDDNSVDYDGTMMVAAEGDTILEAAMRCLVAYEAGIDIEIPDELMEASHDQHIG